MLHLTSWMTTLPIMVIGMVSIVLVTIPMTVMGRVVIPTK